MAKIDLKKVSAELTAIADKITPEMRKTVDQLVVVSRFTFTQDATLQTKAMVPP